MHTPTANHPPKIVHPRRMVVGIAVMTGAIWLGL
jgi:hypothetical protein